MSSRLPENWPSNKTIGERLRVARKRAGCAQHAAQEVLGGMSRPTFIAIEKGRRPVSPTEIITLCNLYGCQVSEIIGGTAHRLACVDPLGTLAEIIEFVRQYEAGNVSEGQLARFLRTDRIGARHLVQTVRAMTQVVLSILPAESEVGK